MKEKQYTERYYNDLERYCLPGKVLIIYGSRQVGKTTLLKHYLATTSHKYKFDSGDNIALQVQLAGADFRALQAYVAGYDLIVIDEAQRIPNIGVCLKILVDQNPELRIIVTGSSSFELAGQVGEPLTGRHKTLVLYPLAQLELRKQYNDFELKERLEEYLIYGSYPEVVQQGRLAEKRDCITELTHSYLLKDVLAFGKLKNSKLLLDLLRLLAFQVGSEVSYAELAQKLMVNAKVVAKYLDLLEQAFVIINLRGFSRNLRKEMTKKSKYYFYDTGIRNALIANFNPLNLRDDLGQLWENFLLIERLKKQAYYKIYANNYFWRTWDQKEIDLIEERQGKLFGYEFKWSPQAVKVPKDWREAYPEASFMVIHPENYLSFLIDQEEGSPISL